MAVFLSSLTLFGRINHSEILNQKNPNDTVKINQTSGAYLEQAMTLTGEIEDKKRISEVSFKNGKVKVRHLENEEALIQFAKELIPAPT